MKKVLFTFTLVLNAICSFGQAAKEVVVPAFKDQYSELVRQLEVGKTAIDYRAFRESFIASEQFKVASEKYAEFTRLKKEMYALMSSQSYPQIIDVTKEMLSIDYTSMIAHKILRQTYKIVGDTANSAKYKTIQFGLLNSIVRNGDGKTCATAWPVIQVEEEYFILEMLGASLLSQSTDHTGGFCDKMRVKMKEGDKKEYYFGIGKVFKGYRKLGLD